MQAATIGHNTPEPFVLFSESIEDLLLEAENFLDGKPIETEEQEKAVSSILTRLRREANAADDARKAEKKPHDEAAKAVQAKWNPLLEKADLAVNTAKSAITKYLLKKQEEQRAVAAAKRKEAEDAAAAAARFSQQADPDNLAARRTAVAAQEVAASLTKDADKADKQRAQARGGERAVGLRTIYRTELTDPLAFGRWAWANRNDEYLTFLEGLAEREGRHGAKGIPGIIVHTEQKAA